MYSLCNKSHTELELGLLGESCLFDSTFFPPISFNKLYLISDVTEYSN